MLYSRILYKVKACQQTHQHWNFSATFGVHGGVAVIGAGSNESDPIIVFGSIDYAVRAVQSGSLLWQFSTGDLVLSTPTCHEESGMCFVGSVDRRMYALDLASGKQHWNATTGGGIEGSATVAEGKVFFGSNDGTLYCVDLSTGRQRWRYETHGGIEGKPAVHNDTVYIISYHVMFAAPAKRIQVHNHMFRNYNSINNFNFNLTSSKLT